MQLLHGGYAQRFNRRHGLSGHLFQGRYGAVLVEDEVHLLVAVRYIVLNPVAAGLCAGPQEWPWNSHRCVVENAGPEWLDIRRLLSYFGAFGGEPLERYREAVAS